jgi:hypothetical protein
MSIRCRTTQGKDRALSARNPANPACSAFAFLNAIIKCDASKLSEQVSTQMRIPTYRVAVIAAVLSSGMFFADPSVAQMLPPGQGQDIVQNACTMCHGVDVIVSQRHTPDEWRDIVSRMIGNGASLTDDQYVTVVKYLGTKLAPQGAASAPTTSPAHAAH